MNHKTAGEKIALFIVGIAVPMAVYLLWVKTDGFRIGRNRHSEVDRAHDITIEDSFPASDPPSAW